MFHHDLSPSSLALELRNKLIPRPNVTTQTRHHAGRRKHSSWGESGIKYYLFELYNLVIDRLYQTFGGCFNRVEMWSSIIQFVNYFGIKYPNSYYKWESEFVTLSRLNY